MVAYCYTTGNEYDKIDRIQEDKIEGKKNGIKDDNEWAEDRVHNTRLEKNVKG